MFVEIKYRGVFYFRGILENEKKLIPLLGECTYLGGLFKYTGYFDDAFIVQHNGEYSIMVENKYVVLSTNSDSVSLYTENKKLDFASYFRMFAYAQQFVSNANPEVSVQQIMSYCQHKINKTQQHFKEDDTYLVARRGKQCRYYNWNFNEFMCHNKKTIQVRDEYAEWTHVLNQNTVQDIASAMSDGFYMISAQTRTLRKIRRMYWQARKTVGELRKKRETCVRMGFKWNRKTYNKIATLRNVSNLAFGQKNMDGFECGICFCVVENPDARISVLNCGHSFCTDCVERCEICPNCRKNIYLESPCGVFYIDNNGF